MFRAAANNSLERLEYDFLFGVTSIVDEYYAQHTCLDAIAKRLPLFRRIHGQIKDPSGTFDCLQCEIGGNSVELSLFCCVITKRDDDTTLQTFESETDKLGPIVPSDPSLKLCIKGDHGFYRIASGHGFTEIFIESKSVYTIRIAGKAITGSVIFEKISPTDTIELDFSLENPRIILRRLGL